MELEQISRLLQNAEAQPSAQCWERLSEQLGTLPSAATAGSTAGKAVLKQGLSTWAKVGIGLAAATIVATTAILLIPSAEEPALVQQTPLPPAESMELPQPVLADTAIMAAPVQPTIASRTGKKDHFEQTEIQNRNGVQPVSLTIGEGSLPQTAAQNEVPSSPAMVSQPVASPTIAAVSEEQSSVAEETAVVAQPSVQEENEISATEMNLEIPNVITPNGDGVNDVFVIQHLEECSQHHLIIKNQAGKQVLATQHYDNGWGGDVAEGTYFYQLSYKIGEVTKYRNGIITVIR